MARLHLSRRRLLGFGAAGASSLMLAGCDQFDFMLNSDDPVRNALETANDLTYAAQRLLVGRDTLAREYSMSEVRQGQRPNGVTDPMTEDYLALKAGGFADYRLPVGGLVDTPKSYSLAELQNMPARTQVTRHDCVEGWSCIAQWTGVPLSRILDEVGVKSTARYVVFQCYDNIQRTLSGDIFYYGSIDLIDARHPQTILAYGCNNEALPVANGAPLRVRVERQLGYKMPKYLKSIELVDSFSSFGKGKGGYWEDVGYDWYGGI
jgi:DMSO/TMAO reductase YedYZ molybdopterin-dependent catalytic subunit